MKLSNKNDFDDLLLKLRIWRLNLSKINIYVKKRAFNEKPIFPYVKNRAQNKNRVLIVDPTIKP